MADEFEKNFRLFFANENCKSCPNEMKAEKCSDFDECSAFGRVYYAAGYKQAEKDIKKPTVIYGAQKWGTEYTLDKLGSIAKKINRNTTKKPRN